MHTIKPRNTLYLPSTVNNLNARGGSDLQTSLCNLDCAPSLFLDLSLSFFCLLSHLYSGLGHLVLMPCDLRRLFVKSIN